MPKVVERSTVKPWFRDTPAAKVVRLAVSNGSTIQKAATKLKVPIKVVKEATAMKVQWDEEAMTKVLMAISNNRYGRTHSV